MPPVSPASLSADVTVPPATAGFAPFSSREFRTAMGQFATGVVVISTDWQGQAHAMTANAFMSGSLEPPLVIVSIACTARMHEKIGRAGAFGISVLSQAQINASNHFAGRPSSEFAPDFARVGGLPVVAGANVQLAAQLCHVYPCGDHTLFVGEVHALVIRDGAEPPLLFHGGRYSHIAS